MNNKSWILIGIVILSLFLRVYLMDRPLTLDEPWTVSYIDRSFESLIEYIPTEYRMPLYYFIAWWIHINVGVYALKVFSVLAGVLTVIVMYFLGKMMFNKKIGLIASFIMAISPVHIAYSQYVREYSLFLLFFAVSMLAFYNAIKKNDRNAWIFLTIANTLLFLTHFISILFIFSQLVAILLLKRNKVTIIKRFLFQIVAVLAISAPWLIHLANTVNILGVELIHHDFTGNVSHIFYIIYKFSIGVNVSGFMSCCPLMLILVIPFFSLILLLAFFNFYKHDTERGKLLFTMFLLPNILLFVIALAVNKGIFIYRYLSPLLVIYVLIISAYMGSITKKRMAVLLSLLIVLYSVAITYYYSIVMLAEWVLMFGI